MVQHEDLMVASVMLMVQAHMMVQGFVDEYLFVQKTTSEVTGIKGLGYCLLPSIFPPSQDGSAQDLCPRNKLYDTLELDNVNTLILSVAIISGTMFFGGSVFLWGQAKLTIRDLELYFNPVVLEVEEDEEGPIV
tara:strand:+ start:102 stop:503 length:402 start_codon:yes stop_codon:yes gene_type:complete